MNKLSALNLFNSTLYLNTAKIKAIALQIDLTIERFLTKRSSKINWDNLVPERQWNNKEIIGHLIDSALVNLMRFVRCTYEDGFKLIYQQDEWVAAQHYKSANIAELLQLWQLLNRQIMRVLMNFPSNRLTANCDTSKDGVTFNTVEFLADDYLAHMQHHLAQLYQTI